MPRICCIGYYSRVTAVILCCTGIIGCSGKTTVKTDIPSAPWQTYLYNKERTATTEDMIVLPPGFSTLFSISRGPTLLSPYDPAEYSAPAVVDTIAYIGSSNNYFYAFDLKKAKELWKISTSGAVESSPTVAEGRVYFGTSTGHLYCLDIKSGLELWKLQVRAEIISSPVVDDGIVYFNSADDKLHALKADSGERLWQYTRGYARRIVRRTFSSPAVSGKMIYAAFSDGSVVALDKSTGNELWKTTVERPLNTWFTGASGVTSRFTPTIDHERIYFIDSLGNVVALDAVTGEEQWRFNIIPIADFAIHKQLIFLAGYDGSIIAMNRADGEVRWRKRVSKGTPASLMIAGEYLIVASNFQSKGLFTDVNAGNVDIFTLDKGKILWSEELNSTISTGPVVAYDRLLVVTDRGHLRIYKSKDKP